MNNWWIPLLLPNQNEKKKNVRSQCFWQFLLFQFSDFIGQLEQKPQKSCYKGVQQTNQKVLSAVTEQQAAKEL